MASQDTSSIANDPHYVVRLKIINYKTEILSTNYNTYINCTCAHICICACMYGYKIPRVIL